MVNLEIEILSEDAKDDIYELRSFLAENVEDLQLAVKKQAAVEGQMSALGIETILFGVIHAGVGLSIERCIHILWPLIKDWIKRKKAGKKIEVLATLGDSVSNVTISADSDGVSKRYDNVSYSINTAHTRAVLIGCSEFENDFPAIPPVKSNVGDLYRILVDKRNIGLLPENITVALDKTNSEIEETLLRISRLPDTETLLIYFSGHGYRSDINKLHLVAKNTKRIDDYILNGIDYDFIKNVIVRSSPAKQKIVILDACHSGIATQGAQDSILDINVTGTYVLASSESDEVSYFDKNKRNTFFTGILLDTLGKGINNEKEMLSLDDLYENAKTHLDQKQQPRFKETLNISPADFFIARNRSFSLEKKIQKAAELYRSGKLANALAEYKKILQKQPDNAEIRKLADQCNNDLLFSQFMKQADELFYKEHNYKKALELYQQAYELRPDFSIAEKISNCKENIETGQLGILTPEPKAPEPPKVIENTRQEGKKAKEVKQELPEKNNTTKKVFALGITIAVVFIGWLLLTITKKKDDKTNIHELSLMLSTDPVAALAKLQKEKQNDSANYILGNYYNEEEKYDSAAFYYNNAINISNLPAAYLSLALLYRWRKLKDSSDKRIAYSILLKADSLHKADTAIYYQLGELKLSRMPGDPNEQTEKWWIKGHKKGSKECGYELAFLYLEKRGNPVAAFPFMKEAAENNFTRAQIYLSDMLTSGNGVIANKEEGEKWFKLFLKNAESDQLASFAERYMPGSYDENFNGNDCSKALELYTAAETRIGLISDRYYKGKIYSDISRFYENGCGELVKKDKLKAKQYREKAIEMGYMPPDDILFK